MKSLLVLFIGLCALSASASHLSCIYVSRRETDPPPNPSYWLRVFPEGGENWKAIITDNSTNQTRGTYRVRRLYDSRDYTAFASPEFSLLLHELGSYHHRSAELKIPALGIDSTSWVCKEAP